jgi:hypothetical protein
VALGTVQPAVISSRGADGGAAAALASRLVRQPLSIRFDVAVQTIPAASLGDVAEARGDGAAAFFEEPRQ